MGFSARTGRTPVVAFATLGSTNAEALARASLGERGPLWIVAERQTAGRGRRGREWVSEPGNLYASLLLTDVAPAAATPEICFVAALALHDAVLDCCAGLAPARLTLKWPNDLLLDGGKLAGNPRRGKHGRERNYFRRRLRHQLPQSPAGHGAEGDRSSCRRVRGRAGGASGRARWSDDAAACRVGSRAEFRGDPRRLADARDGSRRRH